MLQKAYGQFPMRITGFIKIIFVALVVGCAEKSGDIHPPGGPPAEAWAYLDAQRSVVLDYARTGNCLTKSSCRIIGLGAKPCGGPASWLVYSASIDTVRLVELVDAFYVVSKQFNEEWGLMSDCSIAMRPDSVACLGGKCVGYYKGVPKPN